MNDDTAPINVTIAELVAIFRKKHAEHVNEIVECLSLITPKLIPLNDSQLDSIINIVRGRKAQYYSKKRAHRKSDADFDIKYREWLSRPLMVKKNLINKKGHFVSSAPKRGAQIDKLLEELSKKPQKKSLLLKPIDLYFKSEDASSRAVMLAAKAIGIELNYIAVDFTKGDHLKKPFLKMNPQHCVPVINDNGFVVNESQAILRYLGNSYGKNDSLYPIKDTKKRALVDMRLEFDQKVLNPQFHATFTGLSEGSVEPNPEKVGAWEEVLGWLNMLVKDGFSAGYHLSIADFSIMTTLEAIEKTNYDMTKYQNIVTYIKNCKEAFKDLEKVPKTAEPETPTIKF